MDQEAATAAHIIGGIGCQLQAERAWAAERRTNSVQPARDGPDILVALGMRIVLAAVRLGAGVAGPNQVPRAALDQKHPPCRLLVHEAVRPALWHAANERDAGAGSLDHMHEVPWIFCEIVCGAQIGADVHFANDRTRDGNVAARTPRAPRCRRHAGRPQFERTARRRELNSNCRATS